MIKTEIKNIIKKPITSKTLFDILSSSCVKSLDASSFNTCTNPLTFYLKYYDGEEDIIYVRRKSKELESGVTLEKQITLIEDFFGFCNNIQIGADCEGNCRECIKRYLSTNHIGKADLSPKG